MQKSKAISLEINNLFEKIEEQAKDYENAFVELNKFFRNADRTQRAVEELFDKNNNLYTKNLELFENLNALKQYIDLRIENMLDDLKELLYIIVENDFTKKVDDVINNFKQRAEQVLGLIEGKEGITELIKNIKNISNEIDEKILRIDNNTTEIDNRILNLKDKSKEIDFIKEEYHKTISSLENKHYILENRIEQKLENKIDTYFSKIAKEYTSIFDDYETKIQNMSFNLEERIKKTIIELKDSQMATNSKIRTIETKIDTFIALSDRLVEYIKHIVKEQALTNTSGKQ